MIEAIIISLIVVTGLLVYVAVRLQEFLYEKRIAQIKKEIRYKHHYQILQADTKEIKFPLQVSEIELKDNIDIQDWMKREAGYAFGEYIMENNLFTLNEIPSGNDHLYRIKKFLYSIKIIVPIDQKSNAAVRDLQSRTQIKRISNPHFPW